MATTYSNKELDNALEKYTDAVIKLAEVQNKHHQNDVEDGIIPADMTLYDYLHQSIDFDQLCKDVAAHIESIRNS